MLVLSPAVAQDEASSHAYRPQEGPTLLYIFVYLFMFCVWIAVYSVYFGIVLSVWVLRVSAYLIAFGVVLVVTTRQEKEFSLPELNLNIANPADWARKLIPEPDPNDPRTYNCAYCGSRAGTPCRTPTGAATRHHRVRFDTAQAHIAAIEVHHRQEVVAKHPELRPDSRPGQLESHSQRHAFTLGATRSTFEDDLADTLARATRAVSELAEDYFVFVAHTVSCAQGLYVQGGALAEGRGMLVEASSNQFLETSMTTSQIVQMKELGWNTPEREHPNFWKVIEPHPQLATTVGDFLAQTLLQVHHVSMHDKFTLTPAALTAVALPNDAM